MRLERKRDAELARRKGMTLKTIIALLWFGLCFIAAYYMVNWLFDTEVIRTSFFYSRLLIPRSVNQATIRAAMMVLTVILIQFFVLLGYAFGSPLGRVRPGRPTMRSREPDPNADHYDYR
jgi:hypothetical protein